MEKLIIATTLPMKPEFVFNKNKFKINGFPGILTGLPEGNNVKYLVDYNDLYNIDDNKVDYYMFELNCSFLPNEKLLNWIKNIDSNKIVIGGSAISCHKEKDFEWLNASKIIVGYCDDIMSTIQQSGKRVKGIYNFKKLPRYDLFDMYNILKKYEIEKKDFIEYGLLTSYGCLCDCEFCYQSIDCNKLHISKPLDYLDAESKYMVKLYGTANTCFLYDANFTMSNTWKEALTILNKNQFSKNFNFFASADTISLDDIKFIKDNNVCGISMGIEDVNKYYPKNDNIKIICDALYDNKIIVNIGWIINPEDMIDPIKEKETLDKLENIIYELKPTNLFPNYLKLLYGTRLYQDYSNRLDFNMNEYLSLSQKTEFDNINAFVKNKEITKRIIENQFNIIKKYKQSNVYKKIKKHFQSY